MKTMSELPQIVVLSFALPGVSMAADPQASAGLPAKTDASTETFLWLAPSPLEAPRVLPTISPEEYAAAKAAADAQTGGRVLPPTSSDSVNTLQDAAKPANTGNSGEASPAEFSASLGAPEMPSLHIAPPVLPTISQEEYAAAKAAAEARVGFNDKNFLLNPDSNPAVTGLVAQAIGLRFQFASAVGKQYRVEASEQLLPASWLPLEGAIKGSGSTETVAVVVSSPQRFFRVIEVP